MDDDANPTEHRASAAERVAVKRRQARQEAEGQRRRRAAIAGVAVVALIAAGIVARVVWSGGLLANRLRGAQDGGTPAATSPASPGGSPSMEATSATATATTAATTASASGSGAGEGEADGGGADRGAGAGADPVAQAALDYRDPKPVDPETLTKASPSRKLVAITLDDGDPFNEKLLELFEEHGVRCTTFLLGRVADSRPDLIRRLHRAGFEIANHSWDHPFLTKLSDSGVRSQLSRTQQAISRVTKNQAPYMRPPYGDTDSRIKRIAGSMGYKVVLWNRTFADTSPSATPEQLYKNVMDGLAPGDIILCHWGSEDTYQAMKRILPEMKRRGFTPVTLSELLADSQR